MKIWLSAWLSVFLLVALTTQTSNASAASIKKESALTQENTSDFNPFAEDVEDQIKLMDEQYKQETGLDPILSTPQDVDHDEDSCFRMECPIYILVSKATQTMKVYLDGELAYTFPTSTGREGFTTPNFDTNPNGRVYKIYSSTKYPGYNNMPYAIFIRGGFAIHGAPGSEDAQLGQVASHGCVRVRTSNAKILNEIVAANIASSYGSTQNIWITVR